MRSTDDIEDDRICALCVAALRLGVLGTVEIDSLHGWVTIGGGLVGRLKCETLKGNLAWAIKKFGKKSVVAKSTLTGFVHVD